MYKIYIYIEETMLEQRIETIHMYVQQGSHGGAFYVPVEIQSALFTLHNKKTLTSKIKLELKYQQLDTRK